MKTMQPFFNHLNIKMQYITMKYFKRGGDKYEKHDRNKYEVQQIDNQLDHLDTSGSSRDTQLNYTGQILAQT